MEKNAVKLMIPGPIQPDDAVLSAMGEAVRPHYGPEWTEYYKDTLNIMKNIFATEGDVFIMNGSGSTGLDACMGSALSTGEKIIIGINGFFGERLKSIAEENGLEVVPVFSALGQPLNEKDIANALKEHPDAAAVSVVHLETSTTVVNPIDRIGPLVRDAGRYFIVDAVSSLGGLPMQMDEWAIDLCASASQKCLGAPPGLSPVAVGARGWEAVDRNPKKAHGWYSNLRIWRQYAEEWGDWHPSPVTLATNNIVSLRTSLEQLLAEGISNRLERYRKLAIHLREGLRSIGMPPYTPDMLMAPVLTAAYGPEGVDTDDIVTYLSNQYHIKISMGLGDLKGKIFRIGHMSPNMSINDIDEVIQALSTFKA